MINDDWKVKLIDHGSAFAGKSFDPANDKNSFIPYYLRAFTKKNFAVMKPEQRITKFPTFDHHVEEDFGKWVEKIDVDKIASLLSEYGIAHQPTLDRLKMIKSIDPKSRLDWLLGFWAGMLDN